jgi:hypothetical protein
VLDLLMTAMTGDDGVLSFVSCSPAFHVHISSRDETLRKRARKGQQRRSSSMPIIIKRLRLVFYLLATLELVLVSVVWGRLPIK